MGRRKKNFVPVEHYEATKETKFKASPKLESDDDSQRPPFERYSKTTYLRSEPCKECYSSVVMHIYGIPHMDNVGISALFLSIRGIIPPENMQ